jgi:hypothetical protein
MTDDPIVAQEQASTKEPVSQDAAPKDVVPKEKSEAQPLTPDIQTLISKSVAEEMDKAKREIQSAKDKARNEVEQAQKRARFLEERLNRVKGGYEGLDPEVRERFELEDTKAQLTHYQQREQEEAARRQAEEYTKKLESSLTGYLQSVGIDASDQRLDWAKDEADFLKGRERFDKSVATILKEKQTASQKAMEDKFKDLERNLRKELGVDSVDTTPSSGGDSDAEFQKKFNAGELPMSKANLDRINKILR